MVKRKFGQFSHGGPILTLVVLILTCGGAHFHLVVLIFTLVVLIFTLVVLIFTLVAIILTLVAIIFTPSFML